jgi:TatD DNase family protein
MLTDSHAHVFWNAFDGDRAEVLSRARQAGVGRLIVVGTNAQTSRAAFELCALERGCYPTAGIHPHDAAEASPADRGAIAALCASRSCVGVGETGLDFFKEYSPRACQEELFRWHIELARATGKAIVVHCRDAHERTASILKEHGTSASSAGSLRGVMHCYSMGPRELAPYLELGFYISFSGMVTYPRNEENRAAASEVPSDRLLIETDCPFLAPQAYRGRRNEPAYLRATLEQLASLRGESAEEVAERTSANAAALFDLPATG